MALIHSAISRYRYFWTTSMASLLIPPPNFTIRSVLLMVILWIGLFCIAEINAGGNVGEVLRKGRYRQREFDYFVLSLQWPGTYCRRTRRCCSSNGCCRGSSTLRRFTIHGLWPNYNDGTWPACCGGKRFDVKEIASLLGALNKYWPSLSCGSPSNCHGGRGLFWEHEWEKHGTCSSSVVGDEYNYFVTALNVYFKYDVTEVLREAGYVASNSEKYPLGGIISAIQNAFHATPELQCSGDAVQELRLCFYKNFEPRDCAVDSYTASGMLNWKKSCPRYISLPEYAGVPEYVWLKLGNNKTEVSQSTLQSSI